MAAGLGFKTFNTGDVLSAADVNGYLMQGVLVFANAAARDAAITSPQEGQFAYLKDTNVTTYYTGSAWANLDTTGMTNPMTTTGDTIYSSSGSTPARLGIGTAGQVLKVNAGGTAPEWGAAGGASGLTLIQRTSFSNVAGTSTTFDGVFTSTYKSYLILIERIYSGTDSNDMQMQFLYSGSTQSSGYYGSVVKVDQGGTQTITGQGNTSEMTFGNESGISYDAGSAQIFVNKVGNTSENGMIRGQYMEGANANGYSFTVKSNTAQTYTGFLLKSSSTNITGTVAVYGLAI